MFVKWYPYLNQLGRVKVGQLCPQSVLYLLCNVSVLERDLKYDLLMNSRATQNLKLPTPVFLLSKSLLTIMNYLTLRMSSDLP